MTFERKEWREMNWEERCAALTLGYLMLGGLFLMLLGAACAVYGILGLLL